MARFFGRICLFIVLVVISQCKPVEDLEKEDSPVDSFIPETPDNKAQSQHITQHGGTQSEGGITLPAQQTPHQHDEELPQEHKHKEGESLQKQHQQQQQQSISDDAERTKSIAGEQKTPMSDKIDTTVKDSLNDEVTGGGLSFREKLIQFVGGYVIGPDWGTDREEAQENTIRVVSSLALRRNLTEEQIAAIFCVLLCGLGTCPPSCPGYFEPPWGPLTHGKNYTMPIALPEL